MGTRLKEEIQKNIILMILLMIISIPLLSVDTWFENVHVRGQSVREIEFFMGKGGEQFDTWVKIFVQEMVNKNSPLIYFSAPVN